MCVRERETYLASQFCRQRTGRYRFGRPIRSKRSSRENLYMTTSRSSATANVSFFSLRSQIQPFPFPSRFHPDPIFPRSWLSHFLNYFSTSRLQGRGSGNGEKRAEKERQRDSYGRGSPYATHTYTHTLWLEYIGDDNATIATEERYKDAGRRRQNKETKNTSARIFSPLSTATFSAKYGHRGLSCGIEHSRDVR